MALLMREALDREAFAELARRTRRPLYAYAAAVLLDAGAAEDATQRTFELAFAKRKTFRRELGSAEAWLFGIARRVVLDERRSHERRPTPSGELETLGDAATDGEITRADQRAAVSALLQALDESDRELISLKFWSDLSNREIAALVDCSESNVGTRLHRAIGKLRECSDDVA